MWNIILGALFIAGGLSGKFVLRGTDSSTLLSVIGAGLIVLGIYQVAKSGKTSKQDEEATSVEREGEGEEDAEVTSINEADKED